MKKINFLIVFLFISIVDCHISIVKNLIKDEKYKLKGTFTINFAQKQKRYLSIDSGKIIFSGKKQKFDIIESDNNTYHIISRYYKKFVGVSQKQKEKLALYDKLDNKNKELLTTLKEENEVLLKERDEYKKQKDILKNELEIIKKNNDKINAIKVNNNLKAQTNQKLRKIQMMKMKKK